MVSEVVTLFADPEQCNAHVWMILTEGILLTEAQVERWRLLEEERQSDVANLSFHAERDERRMLVKAEMLTFLQGFLTGEISLDEFKIDFDRKTRTDWDVFGLKGMSGAMFLNTLVKHIPDQDEVAHQLRTVLPKPDEPRLEHGRTKMQSFYDYLESLIQTNQVQRRQVQPVRLAFFVSGWWHIQDQEFWPPYYISARNALAAEDLLTDNEDPVVAYFQFRATFQELSEKLNMSSWELEHLLAWYNDGGHSRPSTLEPNAQSADEHTQQRTASDIVEDADEDEVASSADEQLSHSHIQWMLARIGRRLGCHVWIAANDHNRVYDGVRLGELSIESLPSFNLDADLQRTISLIDVIWIQGHNRIAAAFEVESTTSVYSGILRMADLVALVPNLNFPLYIVVPEGRTAKVERELRRPTFQALGLHEQCGYFTFEDLERDSDSIMRWASDPSAIKRLARSVAAVTQ